MASIVQIAHDFVKAISEIDFTKQLSMLSDTVQILGASGTNYGKKELEIYLMNFNNPFKEIRLDTTQTIVSGNTVVVVSEMSGFLVKEYMGIPSVKERFRMPMLNLFEIQDGKVVTWKEYMNWKILEDMSKD